MKRNKSLPNGQFEPDLGDEVDSHGGDSEANDDVNGGECHAELSADRLDVVQPRHEVAESQRSQRDPAGKGEQAEIGAAQRCKTAEKASKS